jgi:hypothetical protein
MPFPVRILCIGLTEMPGPIGDYVFWRLARVHQGSVRNYSTASSMFRLNQVYLHRLNMRSTMQVYRQLGKYLEQVDAEAQARGEGPEDKSVDVHFRSGVHLGVGLSHIILSLMPARLASLVELFGYKGDRYLGLALLQKAGGWTNESPEPSVSQGAPPNLRRWRSETGR